MTRTIPAPNPLGPAPSPCAGQVADLPNPVVVRVERAQGRPEVLRWLSRTWLAYLHFGRLGGRGIPGCGALCNDATKAIWALAGLVPPALFVTGAYMWWSRVVRRWLKSGPAAS